MFPRTCLDAAGASCLLSWSSGKATCWLSEKIQTVKHCLVFHCLSAVLRIKIRWRRGLLCSCLRCKTLYVPVWVASLESASAESDAQGFAEHDGFFFLQDWRLFVLWGVARKLFCQQGVLLHCLPDVLRPVRVLSWEKRSLGGTVGLEVCCS